VMGKPKSTFVFYDKEGRRHEFSDETENCVVVRLEQDFYSPPILYHPGEEIVVPKEVAELIKCKILRKWE